MPPARSESIARLAQLVCTDGPGHPTRVAVDGTTASGKSTVARELAAAVAILGRTTIHLSMDGYHHPRVHRHRKGPLSAEGYYEDAYDFQAFVDSVLVPLGPGGDRRFRRRIIDLATDQAIDEPLEPAPVDAVLIVDGSFLQKPEIVDHWDRRIFVNTSAAVARARGIARDSRLLGGEAAAGVAYDRRYHAAARIYLRSVHPDDRADIVIDNDDLERPVLHVRRPATEDGSPIPR